MKQALSLVILSFLSLTPAYAFVNSQQEVVVYSQPDSPLQLSNVVSKWRIVMHPVNQAARLRVAC